MADHREEWELLFRKWFGRLIDDPGWDVQCVGDEHLDVPASYSVIRPHRQVVFHYRPSHEPADIIACHEVAHVLNAALARGARQANELLPDSARQLAEKYLSEAEEQAADDLARAFCRAYGEADGQATDQV